MSRSTGGARQWEIAPAASKAVIREQDGRLTLPLQINRHDAPVATARLLLTVAEAEQLHASLCHALDKEPVPDGAPECRKPIQYPGGRHRF
ncbi:hypothetical protein ACWD4L_34440 [Streptomyces sp. NPDC002596]|uniref:hypothetical protein n=1 Tax=Streptomyces sp. NPDC059460 TaxID=3346840 RepID=UPI0036AF9376